MTYGMVSESENKKGSFEYHRVASDGKAYGIFKECSKYYIKTAPGDKETIAEAYDYIGGWNNRKDYEYDSYANAQKQFDLKMMSINEACNVSGNATTLDPSKKQEFIVEGTDKMKQEIARQRQIFSNVNTIMTEGSYIGVGDPERVSGNNDEDKPYTEKGEAKLDKDMPKATGKPESESEPYGDGKAPEKGKDVKSGDVLSKGEAVAAQHPSGGKVVRVNEGCDGECGAPNGAKDWGTEGIGKGNGDPKSNGWEMEGQEYVNEEINDAKEWDKGLPGGAGTGEADTDHNNDPYKDAVNESEEDEYEVEGGEDEPKDVEGDDAPEEGGEDEPKDVPSEDVPAEGDSEIPELGGEDGELGDDEGLGDELDDEDSLDSDLEAEIAELRAEVEALKAQIGGDDELGGEEGLGDVPAEGESELGGEEGLGDVPAEGEGELGGEDEIDLGDEDGDVDEGIGLDALKGGYQAGREAFRDGDEMPSKAGWDRFYKTGDMDGEDSTGSGWYSRDRDAYDANPTPQAAGKAVCSQPGVFGNLNRRALGAAARLGHGVAKAKHNVRDFAHNTLGIRAKSEPAAENELEESKQNYMKSIVESVVKSILEEDKTVLHDFGNHPGYRKKPMDLPQTGSDNENGMRDWNDDSVHSEEPFGKSIGDGKPYEKLVQVLTDRVMENLKKKA